MVGKTTRVRQKLHQEAVKLQRPDRRVQRPDAGTRPGPEEPPAAQLRPAEPPAAEPARSGPEEPPQQVARQSSFPSRIFAGTKISPEALVQKLNYEEPPDVPLSSRKGRLVRKYAGGLVRKYAGGLVRKYAGGLVRKYAGGLVRKYAGGLVRKYAGGLVRKYAGPEQRKLKTKRVKLNEKRERWMKKMTSIRLSRVQQAAEARRRATPVVGDMRPLADALPELCQLVASAEALTSRRKGRKDRAPVKKPEPTDFSQMKQSQKRKLLETESSRFSQAVKMLSNRTNPLADIGEQLRRRMAQEEEEGPSQPQLEQFCEQNR
ncbi:ribosome biogenesis protein SLX9 homolog [Xenentodon cancila]